MSAWLVNLPIKYKVIAQHKTFIISVGLLFATILFFINIVAPQREAIAVLEAQYQVERTKLKVVESYTKQYPDPSMHLKELDRKLTQIDAKLPNQPEIGEFLKEIEQAAKISSIRLAEIKPSAAVNKEGYREIPIEISLKGSFANLLEFIKAVEASQRFDSIVNTNIQARQGILDVKLTMVIYSFGVAAETKQLPQNPVLTNKK